MRHPLAVFCDFDGTITIGEHFVELMYTLAPQAAGRIIPEMLAGRTTLAVGVREILESIPASEVPRCEASYAAAQIRPGFGPFLGELHRQGIPFIVVTGGLEEMARRVLQPYLPWIAGIHGASLRVEQGRVRVDSRWEGDGELVSKVRVARSYGAQRIVAIGDSITDLCLAEVADVVYARARLAEELHRRRRPFIAYEDFAEIQRHFLAEVVDSPTK